MAQGMNRGKETAEKSHSHYSVRRNSWKWPGRTQKCVNWGVWDGGLMAKCVGVQVSGQQQRNHMEKREINKGLVMRSRVTLDRVSTSTCGQLV